LGNIINTSGHLTINELFEKTLTIPEYQRPYAWNDEQVIALIEDLIEAFNSKKDKYLIGNMIFHKEENEDNINIVDGQQRTITLALILKCLTNEDNPNVESFLNNELSELSYKVIKNNFLTINNKLRNYKSDRFRFEEFLLNNTIITYIKAKDLDEAFMLFDSQNTRGKPLERKDLLKVHHIRFISEYLTQKQLAKKWEEITEKKDDEKYDKVDILLNNLMIIRKAVRHELSGDDLVYLDVFKEFLAEDGEQVLNNYNQPPIFENFDFNLEKNELSLVSKSFDLKGLFKIGKGLEYLPFEIIQSIEGGEKFFWFVMKYSQLLEELKKENIFNAFDNLSGNGNIFLKKIYQSVLILFVDKFGKKDLEEFAIKVFILLFYFRYNKDQVRKEGVVKFEWNDANSEKQSAKKLDFYNLIFLKYSSKVVLREVDKYITFYVGKIEKDKISGVKKDFFNSFSKNQQIIKILGI